MNWESAVAWANENTGFMMGVLTALYVVATIWIVWESRRTNKFQANAIRQAADLELARNRPYLVFHIEAKLKTHSDNDAIWFFEASVSNVGRTSAHSVCITTNPDFSTPVGYGEGNELKYRTPTMLTDRISILPPGHTEIEELGPTQFLYEQFGKKDLKFQVFMTYLSSAGEQYKDDYTIDLGERSDKVGSADAMEALRFREVDLLSKISDELSQLNRTLSAPDRGRMFSPIASAGLSKEQCILLEEISKQFNASSCDEVFLSMHHRGADLVFSDGQESKRLPVTPSDVEQLCRAGLLVGRYDSGTLFCSVAPAAESFLADRT